MDVPKIDLSAGDYLSIAKQAGEQIRKIIDVPDLEFDLLRSELCKAMRGAKQINGTKELHSALLIEIEGKQIVLLTVVSEGTPNPSIVNGHTMIIRGAMTVDRARELFTRPPMAARKAFGIQVGESTGTTGKMEAVIK